MGELRELGKQGDTKTVWDKCNAEEVRAARGTFEALTAKGYSAFHVSKKGKAKGRMDEFDPDAEMVILVPPVVGG